MRLLTAEEVEAGWGGGEAVIALGVAEGGTTGTGELVGMAVLPVTEHAETVSNRTAKSATRTSLFTLFSFTHHLGVKCVAESIADQIEGQHE